MKKNITLMLFLILICLTANAQNVSGNITNAFKQGNAALITQNLNEKVDFIVNNSAQNLAKQQFIEKLNGFFSQNNPKDFKVLHESNKDNSGFLIGKLLTTKMNFRVHVLFKQSNNQYLINQIRIDNFNE